MYEIRASDCRIVDSMLKSALHWEAAESPEGQWPGGSDGLLSRRIERFKSLVDACFEQEAGPTAGDGIRG